jgi:putative tryptophan/tyrosine transport system substrate-binding protein
MNRRTFISSVAVILVMVPLAADAQPATRIPRIGFLVNTSGPTDPDRAFMQGLTDLGYINGKNIVVDPRYSNGRSELFPEFVADFLRIGVDIIVGWGPPAVVAASRATRDIPIVFIAVADPVGAGFVETLSRPGGNITGIGPSDELGPKRLEILKQAIPSVRHVAVLINPAHPQADAMGKALKAAARALGIEIDVLGAASASNLPETFSAMKQRRVNAFAVQPDVMFYVHRHEILSLASREGLPAIYFFKEFAQGGGLLSYAVSLDDMARLAAAYVAKILKGAKPADLPVEQPTKYELVINLKTAKALGLTIPPSLLLRADQVIE